MNQVDTEILMMTDEEEKNPTVIRIFGLIAMFFKWEPEKFQLWLITPNPLLGGCIPMHMIHKHREEKLLKFIENQMDGNVA